jgi:hypothetical protein
MFIPPVEAFEATIHLAGLLLPADDNTFAQKFTCVNNKSCLCKNLKECRAQGTVERRRGRNGKMIEYATSSAEAGG